MTGTPDAAFETGPANRRDAPERSPLLGRHGPEDLVAFGDLGERRAKTLVADAARIAEALPPSTPNSHVQLVFEHDRYAMAASLLAASLRGHAVALPQNTRPDSILAILERPEVVEIVHDTDSAAGVDVRALLAEEESPAFDGSLTRSLDPNRRLATLFTSGSTGQPTACPKSASQLFEEAERLTQTFAFGAGTRFLSTVSPGHIYGLLWSILIPLVSGGAFGRETPQHAGSILHAASAIAAHHPAGENPGHVLITVPAQLRVLARTPGPGLESIARVISSTAPLPAVTATRFFEQHGRGVTEILGSTETGGIAYRVTGSGPPIAWTPFASVTVSVDEADRLAVDSPFLPPDLPRPVETGDLARLHPDGRFDHLGRIDGIVKVGGRRVALAEMEEFLRELPGVEDAAVAAVPDEAGRGQRLVAALAPQSLAPEAIRERMLDRFDASTLPRRLRFVAALPREPNGKLPRSHLLRLFDLDVEGRPRAQEIEWGATDIEHEEDLRRVRRTARVPTDYVGFDGHFDGYPILAGAVQLKELVMPLLREGFPEIDSVRGLHRVKWNARIQPGETLQIELERRGDRDRVSFRILRGDVLCSSGGLRLGRPAPPTEAWT